MRVGAELCFAELCFAAIAATAPSCVPLYKKCDAAAADTCCDGASCVQKSRNHAQCLSKSAAIAESQNRLEDEGEASVDSDEGEESDEGELSPSEEFDDAMPVGSLEAMADPEAWAMHDDDEWCTLQRIAGDGDVIGASPRLLAWRVPSTSIEMKTSLGVVGVNLCGAARPSDQSHCSALRKGRQPAFLMPSALFQGAKEAAGKASSCVSFGDERPAISLLSRSHPARGVELVSRNGDDCPNSPDQQTSLTIALRCDPDAEAPVLKDAVLKGGCDLELEFASSYGCPDDDADDEEGEGGGEDDEQSDEPRWSQCLEAESGCALGLLLDPTCNPECASDECFWDNGACHPETMGCLGCDPAWLADGEWCAIAGAARMRRRRHTSPSSALQARAPLYPAYPPH